MKSLYLLLFVCLISGLICCSGTSSKEQQSAKLVNKSEQGLRTAQRQAEIDRYLQGFYRNDRRDGSLFLVIGDSILAYKSESRYMSVDNAFKVFQYEGFVAVADSELKDQLGLSEYDLVSSMSMLDEGRICGWLIGELFYTAIPSVFYIGQRIVMMEGATEKEIHLYKMNGRLMVVAPAEPNREISYVSVKDSQIVLTNGWRGPIQLKVAAGNLDVEVLVQKRISKIEFGEQKLEEIEKYSATIVKMNSNRIDYICNSFGGVHSLAEQMNKTIERTQYPFLLRLVPKQKKA